MRISIIVAALAGIALFGAACASESTKTAPPVPTTTTIEVERESADDIGDLGNTATLDTTRAVQRMPIAVLEASIPVVAGPHITGSSITWKDGNNQALADNIYGAVLGRPDYVTVTEENPAPSSLYVKFMRDMARDVCTRITESDIQRAQANEATLWRFAPIDGSASDEQINENLRYLTLRFLGMRLQADDPYIAQLLEVFEAGRAGANKPWAGVNGDPEGWRTVCIGLLESPAFHID